MTNKIVSFVTKRDAAKIHIFFRDMSCMYNRTLNTTKPFGKDIATALSLPNAHRYTGHWSRTTAVNILIQNGATIEQTMMVTGKF